MENTNSQPFILAVDPGRDKCGFAVLTRDGVIIQKAVVLADDFAVRIADFINTFKPEIYAVGSGTHSRSAFDILKSVVDQDVMVIDETGSTLQGRELAWMENPTSGFIGMLPKVFWPTPPDVDAWAAVVIGRRALRKVDPGVKPGLPDN